MLVKKKKELLPSVMAWMDLDIIMLSEINQSDEDKYDMIIYKETNEQNKLMNKINQRHGYMEHTDRSQMGGGREDWKRLVKEHPCVYA